MKTTDFPSIVMLPAATVEKLQEQQQKILEALESLNTPSQVPEYYTAVEFMEKVKCCRATFDQLRAKRKIKVIRKGRKLFVPSSQVKAFFEQE